MPTGHSEGCFSERNKWNEEHHLIDGAGAALNTAYRGTCNGRIHQRETGRMSDRRVNILPVLSACSPHFSGDQR